MEEMGGVLFFGYLEYVQQEMAEGVIEKRDFLCALSFCLSKAKLQDLDTSRQK